MQMTIVRAVGVVLATLVAGCGPGQVDGTGETGSRDIGTAGGEVRARDTLVTLPEGAVEETLTITIKRAPVEELPEGAIGSAVDLGPDGAQFKVPVTVQLKFDPAQLPEPDRTDLVWVGTVVDGEWEPLADLQLDLENNTVRGTTLHFSRFSAVFGCGRDRLCPVQLGFASPPQVVTVGDCSEPVELHALNYDGNLVPVMYDTVVALGASDSSLAFYADSGCQREINSLTIPTNGRQATFYFRGRADRSVTITAAARDLTDASQDEQIVLGPAVQFGYFSASQWGVISGECSSVATVAFEDAYGDRFPVPNDALVTLAASGSANVTFYSDDACTTATSGVTIPAGTASASFYFSGNLTGTPPQVAPVVLTATVSAFGGVFSATQDATIVPLRPEGIRFFTLAQTLEAGRCSAPITVGAVDGQGNGTAVPTDTRVDLGRSPGLVLYSDQMCTNEVWVLTIPAHGTSASFYFKGDTAGTYSITALSVFGAATQQETIQ